MLNHSFNSISVRVLLLALVISHLNAKPDDDQDGPSTNGNINNTQHSSILTMNQAGRPQQPPFSSNNNNLPFSRFQQQQQLGFSPNTFPNGFGGLQQQNTGFPQQQQQLNNALFFNGNPNGFINPGQQQFGSTSGLNNQQPFGNSHPQFGGLQSPFLNQNQLLGLSSSQLSNEQFGTNGQLIGGFPNQQQFGGFQQQQNPFNLGFRNQLFGNPSQFGVSGFQTSQLGGQNQIPIGFQTASGTGQQNNLLAALQNNQLTSQPNPFLQNQFIGFNNQPDNFQQQSGLPFFGQQSGFSTQNPFGLLTNSNSPFIRGALSTGPSSSIIPLSSNQVLIPGGTFQDAPSSLIGTGSTRFLLNNNNNRFNNGFGNPTVAASQFNSQFADNNNNQKLDQRPFRFSTPSATDRSLTFDNNSTNFQSTNPFLAANNNFQGSPFNNQHPNNFQGFSFNGNNLQQFQQLQQPIPIPNMDFSCDGRLAGYYAEMKTGCRTFHICRDDGTNSGSKNSFACPNGTLFSQFRTMCINELEVDCSKSQVFQPQLRPFPTASPFNTQIPSPLGNNNNINTATPSSSSSGSQQQAMNNQNPIFNVGLPSPSMGSLDFGRSLRDTSGKVVKQDGGNFPVPFRPSLFRSSQPLDNNSDPL